MKRNLFRIFVAFAAFFFAAQPADAQFGNILKKVTKTLDTVSKKDAKIKRTDPAASKDMPPQFVGTTTCLLYTSPSPRDGLLSRMPSSA